MKKEITIKLEEDTIEILDYLVDNFETTKTTPTRELVIAGAILAMGYVVKNNKRMIDEEVERRR